MVSDVLHWQYLLRSPAPLFVAALKEIGARHLSSSPAFRRLMRDRFRNAAVVCTAPTGKVRDPTSAKRKRELHLLFVDRERRN